MCDFKGEKEGMNQYDRMMYCLARSQGARMFTRNQNEAVDWHQRYLDEKKKYDAERQNDEVVQQ